MIEQPNGKFWVAYEAGKPVACGFSEIKGGPGREVKRYEDSDDDTLSKVSKHLEGTREIEKKAKDDAYASGKNKLIALGFTEAEIKALTGR